MTTNAAPHVTITRISKHGYHLACVNRFSHLAVEMYCLTSWGARHTARGWIRNQRRLIAYDALPPEVIE